MIGTILMCTRTMILIMDDWYYFNVYTDYDIDHG